MAMAFPRGEWDYDTAVSEILQALAVSTVDTDLEGQGRKGQCSLGSTALSEATDQPRIRE